MNPLQLAIQAVQEAGGIVTTFKNTSFTPSETDFIASNKLVHETLLKLL